MGLKLPKELEDQILASPGTTIGPRSKIEEEDIVKPRSYAQRMAETFALPRHAAPLIHRIEIPGWRPFTDNQLINCHWTTKAKRKKSDKEFIACYAALQRTPNALGKRKVSLEIVLKGKQKKTDPLAYAKSLCDALVACHLLIDDSEEFMVWGGVTYSRGKEAMTTIVLEEMES